MARASALCSRSCSRSPRSSRPRRQAARARSKSSNHDLVVLAGRRPPRPAHEIQTDGAGTPEVAKNITFDAAAGDVRQPERARPSAPRSTSRSAVPAELRRSGLITIRANYEGDPDYLLGTAPIYSVEPGPDEAARFAFIAPTLDIPIVDPGHGPLRRRLRPALHRLRASPSWRRWPKADLTFWGFPAPPKPRHRTLRERLARATRPAARAEDSTFCNTRTGGREHVPSRRSPAIPRSAAGQDCRRPSRSRPTRSPGARPSRDPATRRSPTATARPSSRSPRRS